MMRDNSQLLSSIKIMAKNIEDFANTIQMISLNVNIEASRITASSCGAKAFKVLAKALFSEYALKAQNISGKNNRKYYRYRHRCSGHFRSQFAKQIKTPLRRFPESPAV